MIPVKTKHQFAIKLVKSAAIQIRAQKEMHECEVKDPITGLACEHCQAADKITEDLLAELTASLRALEHDFQ